MKVKSFNQIQTQKCRLLLRLDFDSERCTLVNTIWKKYMNNIYAYLDNKFGEKWAVLPGWRDKLTIPIPANVYTGRGQ